MTINMIRLYHYTSMKGRKKILNEKFIGQSKKGVYLTPLNPKDSGKIALARNNYGTGPVFVEKMMDGNLDYYIELEIPLTDNNLKKCEADGRELYLYTGDLTLESFSWDSGASRTSSWENDSLLTQPPCLNI